MKKILSLIFLVVIMSIGLFSMTAKASTICSDGVLSYTILNDTAAVTSCSTSAEGGIKIPSTIDGYPVTRIYGSAFINCHEVTSIRIPSSVTIIETDAFSWALNLTGIWVDENNKNYCSDVNGVLFDKKKEVLIKAPSIIEEYTIPDSVVRIGTHAFEECDELSNITMGNNIITIENGAFSGCDYLTNVIIPGSVQKIGDSAFYNCSSMENVTIGNSVTSIGYLAFAYCHSLTTINVPNSVTDIGRAFNQCSNLTSVNIGDGVTYLAYRAFWGCSSLSDVTFGASLKRIGEYAFEDCDDLINVYYRGTENQWGQVDINENNYLLEERVTVHFLHTHTYDNSCDDDCNGCEEKRTVTHVYGASATCTSPQICIECGSVLQNALGHEEVVVKGYSATCDKEGLTDGKKCSVCGQVTVEQEVIAKIEHEEIVVKGYPATCDKEGRTDGKKCSVCGQVTVVQKVIAKISKPSTSTVKSVKAGVKKLTIQWKKVPGVKGYEVAVSTSKKFKKKSTTTVKITKARTVKKTIKKLKSGKKYYVRVRTYKVANGKNIYSPWKKYKKAVKVK